MIRWLDDNLEEFILVVLLIGMTVIMGIQVFARYALGASLSWSEEITRYMFIWSGFLSVSYCTKKCVSIKIEQFVAIFPRRGKAMFKVVNHTVELIFFLYLIPYAYFYLISAVQSGQVSPACHIPMYYVQAAPLFSFILVAFRIISTLGGDRELLESCKDGDIPFVVQNTAPQVTFLPDTAIFDLPNAFTTIEEARHAVDNPTFYEKMEEVYKDGGYRLLGYADQGFRVMSTNKDVKTINDFKGQKIRTMENSFHLDYWKVLGANPTPMTFSEVYIGLQQGTIDAQENPYEVIVSSKLYEQQDYVVETNHLPHYISLIVSDEFYESLDKDQQKIITEAGEIAKEYARKASDDRIADKKKAIKDSGTKIVTLDKKTMKEMQEAAQNVYSDIENNVSKSVFDAYIDK